MEPVPVQELPLEVQFACIKFDQMADEIPLEECRNALKRLYREHKFMEEAYKITLKQKWGICDNKDKSQSSPNGTS